jgi:3-carboxy-cis,cis-muconate cycloisomerase
MSELFWPGEARAGALFDDDALLAAMTRVETAWLRVLHDAGVARDADPDVLAALPVQTPDDVEAGGNPVIGFVAGLRNRLPDPTARWLHKGLTSQDVLDTALMLCARDAADQILRDARRQVLAARDLAVAHRGSVQAGRTLTQHAVPTTFGLTAANWLTGILDAVEDLVRVPLPMQLGGAAGTLAGVAAVVGDGGAALELADALAAEVGLAESVPWHTSRRPVTRVGDALVACVDACGRIANDVLVRSRPEIGELAEPTPGGSSTMPHKHNPVLSVLIRRAAISAPFPAAALHAAAAAAVDERPDGAWHAEWDPLRTLARHTVVAMSQTADLLEGLVVDVDRMLATASAARADLLAEQHALANEGRDLAGYLGATDLLIAAAVQRADRFVKGDA